MNRKSKILTKNRSLSDLSDIEQLLLPLIITSENPKAKRMIYTAIRKYDDLTLPNTESSMRSLLTRYYNSVPVQTYLNMVKSERSKDMNEDISIEGNTGDVSKEAIINDLLRFQKTGNENTKVKATQLIAQIQGLTWAQIAKEQTKQIYVPFTCAECPLYKQEKERLKNKENDNN